MIHQSSFSLRLLSVIIYSLLLSVIVACTKTQNAEEPLSEASMRAFSHLDFLLMLKNNVAAQGWPDFAKLDFFQPVVYYTSNGTYVLNPNTHIRNLASHTEVKTNFDVPVIKLSEKYTDTINFQFSNSFSHNDTTALYYQENVLLFQSFELTRKFIPDIRDIQDWSIMVIHELYHGYQRAIPESSAHFKTVEIPGGPDAFLGEYYKNLDWYATSVEQENELLKSIWINGADLKKTLVKYDSIRTVRIERIKQEYGIDIRKAEDHEILIEGHARYAESLCKRYLAANEPEMSMLSETDKALVTDMFSNYDVSKDKALYDLYNSRYYYQLGYNIAMILEEYQPHYKESIYKSQQDFNSYLMALMR